MRQEEITNRVVRAQAGDGESFDWLVRRFQDRAVAYAASVLGDLQLAQDAAQSAFVDAFLGLPLLRNPEAFSVWLRRIIRKHCDRLSRGVRVSTLPLETADQLPATGASPERIAERHELQEQVGQAIDALPEGERQVIRLFYMGQHSHREIAEFLGVPITTVKSRLHEGRLRLRERMVEMVKDTLYEDRPSRDEVFLARVNGDITKLLSSVASEQEIEVKPGGGDPLSELMASLLVWAIEGEASDILLVPDASSVSVQFKRGSPAQQVMTLAKQLQRPLINRVKMAAEMDITTDDVPQDGTIPIRYGDRDFEGVVSCRPTPQGESVDIYLTRK